MTQWLESLPTPLLALFFCGIAVGMTTVAQIVLHRRWPMDARKPLNEVTGFVIAVVGVVYAVLLASIAILAIERYDRAEDIAENEAGLIGDIYRDLSGIPRPLGDELRGLLADYANTVIDVEWTELAADVPVNRGWQTQGWNDLELFLDRLATFEPTTQGQMAFLQEILSQANVLIDSRRSRMFLAHNPVDEVIWWVVIMGGFSTVGLALLFGVASAPGHLVVSNVLAFSIGLVLLLIFVMDRPFSGASRVTAEPFEYVRQQIDRISDRGG